MSKRNNYHSQADQLVIALNKHKLGAYIYHKANTGSAYIRFENPNLCSVRIGDHDGIERYKYKFNLRRDLRTQGWQKEDGVWRYYAGFNHIDKLIEAVLQTRELRKDATCQREYNQKKFLKENA